MKPSTTSMGAEYFRTDQMKAIVQNAYGSPDILKLEEVEKPTPGDNEVRVRVHAVSLNGSDWEGLRGKPLYARLAGLRKPGNRILGSDIAGRVEIVGKNVRGFRPGRTSSEKWRDIEAAWLNLPVLLKNSWHANRPV